MFSVMDRESMRISPQRLNLEEMSMMLGRVVILVVLMVSQLTAAVTLASPFSDHAVLQHGQPIPVWGTANVGESITVTCAGQIKTVITDAQGRWRVNLDSLSVGGPPLELSVTGSSRIILKDLLVGEVWLCSGQSNMEWPVSGALHADQVIPVAHYPNIRLYTVTKQTSDIPLTTCGGTWTACSPTTIPNFSAVAYFFGLHLHQELQVPIGLINASWGGTPAEAWTSQETLKENAELTEVFVAWNKRMADLPKAQDKFERELVAWKKWSVEEKNAGRPVPVAPRAPEGQNSPYKPATLYNAMLAPLIPYGMRGAIWYQGEANANKPKQYRSLLPAMIGDWRKAWGQGDFPFYLVQLANLNGRNWPEIREAQWLTAKNVPNTEMAVAIDLGEATNVHPKNKQDVGHRLALIALAKNYGKSIEYSGPVFQHATINGQKMTVTFAHTSGGIIAKGGTLLGFEIAGDDRKFLPAEATMVGDVVELHHPSILKPIAVRYAWADNPTCTLYNAAGLPAVPFRSDMSP